MEVTIRPAEERDYDAIWEIFHAVVSAGDAFTFDPEISREDALNYCFGPTMRTYVAEIENTLVGSYYIRPNQPDLGSHVANAGYMVSPAFRGHGIGRKMGEHSLVEVRRLGYRAIQFNFVVSTNEPAVRLWLDLGFEIVGTLPGAFRHSKLGFVDVYVMYQSLG